MRTDGVMRTVDLSKLFNTISLLVYQNDAFCNKETTQSQEWFKNYGMVGNSHMPISLYSHKVKQQHSNTLSDGFQIACLLTDRGSPENLRL